MHLSQALMSLGSGADDAALALLFERMASPIRRLATRLTGDSQLGEECVAETVLSAARSAANWQPRSADPERDARRWVLGIAATTALAMARSRRRARARDARAGAHVGIPHPPAPETTLIHDERAAIVRSALARLPRVYGEAVAARYVDELGVEEAAARLGIPPSTVKTRAFRGLSLLRRRLGAMRALLSLALWPSAAPGRLASAHGLAALRLGAVAASLGAAAVSSVVAQAPAVVPPIVAQARPAQPHAKAGRVIAAVGCSMSCDATNGPIRMTMSASVPLQTVQ